MTVLLTGAAGSIGRMLTARLPALGWQLRLFDRVPIDLPDAITGDITDPDALDRAMAGIDAVVHLAGEPMETTWPRIRDANVEGLFQTFEAARRAGVQRFVWASSNHATGFTPRPDDGSTLADDAPVRPDTLYGVSKAFGEALARYYHDRYGFQVACLRIGTCAETPPDARAQATWLSPDDCARLVDACLRKRDLGYALVWGVSANRDRWWSSEGGDALGYRPVDDAARLLSDPQPERQHWDDVVGGPLTDPWFGIDEVRQREEQHDA